MGDCETPASADAESPLEYHPDSIGSLTWSRNPARGQWQSDSLTGAVASKKVTEAFKGHLRMDGNHPKSVKVEDGLTVRLTNRAGTKVGLSDPAVESGIAVAQRIKVTLGITG